MTTSSDIALRDLLVSLVAFVLPLVAAYVGVSRFRAAGHVVTNYRGRPVALGLVVAWVVWALVVASSALLQGGATPWPQLIVVVVVAVLGTLDDFRGSGDAKGFKGHLGALAQGRVTTGAAKLFGIAVVSLVAGWWIAWDGGGRVSAGLLGRGLLDALAIALLANLVNLLDLRPGRALKSYSAIAVLLVLMAWVPAALALSFSAAAALLLSALAGLLVLFAPVVACWRLDLGEVAMLGDGGANVAGAVLGCLAAATLPTSELAVLVAIALVLNLASERVSFSAVIESNGLLRWLDGLGRLPATSGDAHS